MLGSTCGDDLGDGKIPVPGAKRATVSVRIKGATAPLGLGLRENKERNSVSACAVDRLPNRSSDGHIVLYGEIASCVRERDRCTRVRAIATRHFLCIRTAAILSSPACSLIGVRERERGARALAYLRLGVLRLNRA